MLHPPLRALTTALYSATVSKMAVAVPWLSRRSSGVSLGDGHHMKLWSSPIKINLRRGLFRHKRWYAVPALIAVVGLSGWAMSGCGEDLALKTLPPLDTPIRQAASPVAGALSLSPGYGAMATGADQCWSWTGSFPVRNYYGQTKYTYKEWLGWCTNHNTVTRILWHGNDSYGSNVWHNMGCNVQDQYSSFGYDNYHVYGSCW